MNRSRTGCTTCRARKRKCDETKPECLACQKRGTPCGGYCINLRWGNAVASRGHLAGATTPVLKPIVSAQSSISPTSAGPQVHGTVQKQKRDDKQRQMFDKFVDSSFRFLYATNAGSDFEPLVRQMSHDSNALLSVGAAIQMYFDEGPSVPVLEQVEDALQKFRQEIATCSDRIFAPTMCAGILLGSLHALQGRPWTLNLKLMADLWHLDGDISRLHPSPKDDPQVRHLIEVLAILDMPYFVQGRCTPSLSIWRRYREAQKTWEAEKPDFVESISGLPQSLLDLLASVDDDDVQEVEASLWNWPGLIGEFLQCHLWECWKLAGILGLRRRRKTSSHNVGGNVPATSLILCRLLASMDALIQGLGTPASENLPIYHAALYPIVEASLQVTLLQSQPNWILALRQFRARLAKTYPPLVMDVTQRLFDVLDEAWESGSDEFDINKAVKGRGMEIAVF